MLSACLTRLFPDGAGVAAVVLPLAMALALALIPAAAAADDPHEAARRRMLERDLKGRDITDPRVLEAMARVPRHLFVDPRHAGRAYGDHPLPTRDGQTISQPYIVALMTQWAALRPGDKVLEVGTGSGYQAAVLATLTDRVFSIELHEELARTAAARLARLGYPQVRVKSGDGWLGWPEEAPFDAILVTAAAPEVPPALKEQLADGGRLVIPVGYAWSGQLLLRLTRRGDTFATETICPVAFVPLVKPR